MKLRLLLMPLVLSSSSLVMAAPIDGPLSSSSSDGYTDVTISITDLVQVHVQQDVSMTYAPGSNSTGTTGICIYHREANTAGLTLTSNFESAGNVFNMQGDDAGTTLLPYSVAIGATSYASSVKEPGVTADQTSTTCGSGWNHTISVTVQSADLEASPAANYSDTMTILVEPT